MDRRPGGGQRCKNGNGRQRVQTLAKDLRCQSDRNAQRAESLVALTHEKPAWMGASLHKELRFLGMDNIANKSAIDNLIAMGSAKGAQAVFAHHGSQSGLESHLPGVKVHVLGPPDLFQTEQIKKMRSKDPDQFWHLLAGVDGQQTNLMAADANGKQKNGVTIPSDARWFRSDWITYEGSSYWKSSGLWTIK